MRLCLILIFSLTVYSAYTQQNTIDSLKRIINQHKGDKAEADCNLILAGLLEGNVQITESIRYALDALEIYRTLKDNTGIASSHLVLQDNYRGAEDFTKALLHEFEGERIAEANNIKGTFHFPGHKLAPLFLAETAQTYILKNKPDSALIYAQKSIQQNELFNGTSWEFPHLFVSCHPANERRQYQLFKKLSFGFKPFKKSTGECPRFDTDLHRNIKLI